MDKLIVSACLCGIQCRYDGSDNAVPKIKALYERGRAIAVCPEQAGGLPTPRTPCEISGGKVIDKTGADRTCEFQKGAMAMLEEAKKHGIKKAVLKESSPSCGASFIYDGTFSGKRIPGEGVAAKLLRENGIEVMSEKEFSRATT